MKAYDMTDSEVENSPLADLAKRAGYASLKSLLNENHMWAADTVSIEAFLRDQIDQPAQP
jgi:hypothetical protein